VAQRRNTRKNCSDFANWSATQTWFDYYYPSYGDVARLDADGDGHRLRGPSRGSVGNVERKVGCGVRPHVVRGVGSFVVDGTEHVTTRSISATGTEH